MIGRLPRALAGLLLCVLGGVVAAPAAAMAQAPCLAPGAVIEARPWPQQLLQPERAWPLARGAGVTVAVLDSGVDAGHPQLAGRILSGRDYLYKEGGPANRDCVGHGTAVASIIAARAAPGVGFEGVAPEVRILPFAVSEKQNDDDSGAAVSPAQFAAALRQAVAERARVINVSAVFTTDHPEVRAAVLAAIDADVVVVAAVGNAGQKGNPTPYPAAYDGVVGVGGIDRFGQVVRDSGYGAFVDLVAPADAVVAATPGRGHAEWTGTSFAAPFVAGTAALVRQYWPELTARQVAERLTATASPAPGGPRSLRYGAGVVDPYRAVAERPAPSSAVAGPPVPVRPNVDASALARQRELARQTRVALLVSGVLGAVAGCAVGFALLRRMGRRRRWRPVRTVLRRAAPAGHVSGSAGLFDDLADDGPE